MRYGQILDIRRYKGSLGLCYDMEMVQQMIAHYKHAPAGYALDIGVTKQKDTIIVEVNDGYSLGSYGLDPLLYAKLLSARWAELTKGKNACKF
ncbi:MAG: ATP-grasp domain-containing protein [Lachnospira sp.]|nr:ATP-grasp domain-containing protein [Lachnospira sp.]